jgi:Skp family chaperone for outer membrane proteins
MLKTLFSSLVMFSIVSSASAQTSQPKDKPAKEEPEKEAPKASKADKEESIDLDAFFKKGEENAKTSSCSQPATPADPIA